MFQKQGSSVTIEEQSVALDQASMTRGAWTVASDAMAGLVRRVVQRCWAWPGMKQGVRKINGKAKQEVKVTSEVDIKL